MKSILVIVVMVVGLCAARQNDSRLITSGIAGAGGVTALHAPVPAGPADHLLDARKDGDAVRAYRLLAPEEREGVKDVDGPGQSAHLNCSQLACEPRL